MSQINQLPIVTPVYTDYDIIIDGSDSDKTKRSQLGSKVKAGLVDPTITADDLRDGTSKVVMTSTERTKLAGVQTGAQENRIDSINSLSPVLPSKNLNLTLDNIPNGTTRKAGDQVFDTAKNTQLQAAYSRSQDADSNINNTTKAIVGLANVTNDKQLSTTAGNFSTLPEKPDVQYHLDDMSVIQDSADSYAIKRVSNKTNLIWNAGYIQVRGPSINYNSFTFSSTPPATTYNINSIVTYLNNIYMCIVSHQSSSSFTADLANGYRQLIGGGGSGGISVTVSNTGPTVSGTNIGDLRCDSTNGDIYFRDGTNWILNNGSGGGGGGVNYQTSPTVGNRITFSVGTGANLIEETIIERDPTTNTRTWTSVTQNYTAPTLISCQATPFFGTIYTYPATTNQVRVQVTNTSVQYTVWQAISQGSHTYTIGSGSITINTTATDVEVTSATGTNILDSVCFYTGNVVNNNGTIINNTGVTVLNDNSTNTYGGNINNTNINNSNISNTTINNVTFTGVITGVGIKKGPITRTPAGSSLVITDASSVAISVVNGDNITSGTPNGNYFTYDMSTPGQITVTSRDFLGNPVSESGLVFYYTINY